MRTLTLGRLEDHYNGGIRGVLVEGDTWVCHTMERLWDKNIPFVSCIPPGDYKVEWEYSAKFERALYELRDVEDRTEIKFHAMSWVSQLQGCIGVGLKIQAEGSPFIGTSVRAEHRLRDRMAKKPFMLHIRWWDGHGEE